MAKILVVEDEPAIRRLIRDSLALDGHTLLEAANGDEGLQLARQEVPDILLLDVMMPGALDGLEVCRLARATPALSAVKLVILSARGRQEDLESGTQAGCDAYLVKPFSPMQLIALTDLLLGK